MSHLMQPYSVLLFCAAVLSAIMAVSALKMRLNLGTRSFAVLMSAVSLWAISASCEVLAPNPQIKLFSYHFKYLFIVIVPVAWLSLGLYYANRLRSWRLRHILPLLFLPLATLAMIATNRAHNLMFTNLEWVAFDKVQVIVRNYGPWFWVHTTYSYILLLVGFFSLAKSLIDSPRPYRRQLISLLIGGLTPWVCNMLYIFKGQPVHYLDLTPLAFSISGLSVLWGFIRYRLLDLVPIAHGFVIQNLKDGIIVLDEQNRILELNARAAQLMEAGADDVIGRQINQVSQWWPDSEAIQSVPEEPGLIVRIELDDGIRWIRLSRTPLSRSGRLIGHLVMLVDITSLKMTENALRQSEDRFKSLAENAPTPIFSLNTTLELTYVNPAWTRVLGYPQQEVVGQPFGRFISDQQRAQQDEMFVRLTNGQQSNAALTVHMLHKDGLTRIFDLTVAVNCDTEGRITGIIGLARDISEETKLQEQLLMAKKMEAIGTLAGGIAHDFNNLLMVIQANISLMRLEIGPQDPLQDKLNRVEDQIQSGASLSRQLLGYARKGKYIVQTIDLRNLIEDSLHVISHTNKQIQIHRQIGDEPLLVEADRGQIELVLLNLFVNAVDAMPGGGDLFLNAGMVSSEDLTGSWPDIAPGRYLNIEVTDTGMGMDDYTKERIFEPFFTTKDIGHGTGLGLASVYGVVKNHGGYIRAESSKGEGSTFQILLRAAPAAPHLQKKPPLSFEPGVPALPHGAILIVDDEPSILKFCGEMIETLGYRALRAGGGEEAIRIYRERHTEIDLVILDMIMPVIDGLCVYRVFKTINPDVRVIIASGYGPDKGAKQILAEGPHGNLRKPYTRNELAELIAKVKNYNN